MSSFVAVGRRLAALLAVCLYSFAAVSEARANTGLEAYAVEAAGLEIENIPVSVLNNSGGRHTFWLSVLALNGEAGFLPLLAVAVEPGRDEGNQWLAVWNLAEESPGWTQRLKALAPLPWGPSSGAPALEAMDPDDLPSPYLVRTDRKQRARKRLAWNLAEWTVGFADVLFPAKVLFSSYWRFQDDLESRRFHQIYDLVRLYDQTSQLQRSPLNLSAPGLLDLKYALLINRRALGLSMDEEPIHELVEAYESRLREHTGSVASYLQSMANLHYLGVEQISYSLPGQAPFGRAALLYIRKADLPDPPPPWPGRNPFDLSYNPYEHPAILELAEQDPEMAIPLAFYVFTNDLRLKPLLVADFFDPGNANKRLSIGSMRMAASHLWNVSSLPLLYRSLVTIANHGLEKKDSTRFRLRSAMDAVESARLYARAGWYADPETNALLLNALEGRVLNPLARSFAAEDAIAGMRYDQLRARDAARLGLFLRTIYEDRVRSELHMGRRAVFAADLERYERHLEAQDALRLVERFNREPHQTGYAWSRLLDAWERLEGEDGREIQRAREQFLARLRTLYPHAVPEADRAAAAALLHPGAVGGRAELALGGGARLEEDE